jgi:hypothetical protein
MGYRFTLVLSREITDDESAVLEAAGCAGAIFAPDSLPTNAEVPVTKMDFDVTASPSLAEAIESALEAVKNVPDLSVPGLTVPAQPAHAETAETTEAAATGTEAMEAMEPSEVLEGVVIQEPSATRTARASKPAARKPATRKPAVKKPAVKKASAGPATVPA